MPKIVKDEAMRRIGTSISLPQQMIEALNQLPNKGEIVSMVLEENAVRLFNGDISKAMEFRKKVIQSEFIDYASSMRKKITYNDESLDKIDSAISKLISIKNNSTSLKKEYREIERETTNLIISLRAARNEAEHAEEEYFKKAIENCQNKLLKSKEEQILEFTNQIIDDTDNKEPSAIRKAMEEADFFSNNKAEEQLDESEE
ncbi:MAG: hypothetical protein WC444_05685 [Candidatus Paceibacterota bacterium]